MMQLRCAAIQVAGFLQFGLSQILHLLPHQEARVQDTSSSALWRDVKETGECYARSIGIPGTDGGDA
jgi:hypothetical protein